MQALIAIRTLLTLTICLTLVICSANSSANAAIDTAIDTVVSSNANANLKVNANKADRNLVIVTIDGLRWQEVFRGADPKLINHKDFVKNATALNASFWHDDQKQRRQALMPFFWQTIAKQGAMIGNRDKGSKMSVANAWYFSYPGYSEIFTGIVDNRINSNQKIPNPQVSILEWLNPKAKYQGKLAAFGSWDVFPAIFNVERSKLYVNAGFNSATPYPTTEDNLADASGKHVARQIPKQLSSEITLLNQLQKEIPSPWHNVRLDAFTYRFAKDYLLKVKPKVLAISLGETDDFAHDGHYDQYLYAAKRTDNFIADLWHTIQSTPDYQNNTNLLIITDHGRGDTPADWQHHASKASLKGYMKGLNHFPEGIVGSEHIWFAALGPDIPKVGLIQADKEFKQQQFSATALTLLGEDYQAFNANAAAPIYEVILNK